jgi:GrpB-like predicted nucleotidyltransferase (UPF0157 family)
VAGDGPRPIVITKRRVCHAEEPPDVHGRDRSVGRRHCDRRMCRHLLFRDYLRASPEARAAYADVKFVASRLWRGDRKGYNAAKTRVILDIMEQAEIWAARSCQSR